MTTTDTTTAAPGIRRSVVAAARDAVALVQDGMTVAIGGFINAAHPMTLVRELIRQRRRDLAIVGAASAGLEIDVLIASGCARKVITPYVGAEGLGAIGPMFRAMAQRGELEVIELDEAMYYAGLRAAAQCLPFNPWRAGVGTSYPVVNPSLVQFTDPIRGETLLAVPALDIDVALLHASISDKFGNVQHSGTGFGDRAIAAAADTVVVSVERLVSTEQIRQNPAATSVAGANHIVVAPYGAHPFGSDGHYAPDVVHIRNYVEAATQFLKTGRRDSVDEYLDRFVYGTTDDVEYLERIGLRQLLSLGEY
jgi:glutaconate CoA-transferase, subunit A